MAIFFLEPAFILCDRLSCLILLEVVFAPIVTVWLISAHPETDVFGLALSAISFRLSAKGIKIKVLADC